MLATIADTATTTAHGAIISRFINLVEVSPYEGSDMHKNPP